jgi:hypothetical protein
MCPSAMGTTRTNAGAAVLNKREARRTSQASERLWNILQIAPIRQGKGVARPILIVPSLLTVLAALLYLLIGSKLQESG